MTPLALHSKPDISAGWQQTFWSGATQANQGRKRFQITDFQPSALTELWRDYYASLASESPSSSI
jgi:hypothetical protein